MSINSDQMVVKWGLKLLILRALLSFKHQSPIHNLDQRFQVHQKILPVLCRHSFLLVLIHHFWFRMTPLGLKASWFVCALLQPVS